MITETFELPTHWACALNYADIDGLEDDDIEAIREFEYYMLHKYGLCLCLEVSNDRWFQRYHDATEYGIDATDVSTFTFDVTPE
ncbi:hypothetical protein UFOVP1071_47 [uncultured Caudovirales phage]|uniref:Uncharacterized protein n=1 Tax=uncultured Caudovirales phage TaxID=2100421 RepID=A0A6J5QKV6_9CAUD|nr:hypothetical protein UFOVP1071_47 [uncultured Caudovirales phage]